MRSAAYVGRVGGLAVALGIGAAVASGQGVALASPDSPSDSGGSASTSAAGPSSGSADSTESTHTGSSASSTETSGSPTETAPDTESTDSSDASTTTDAHPSSGSRTRATPSSRRTSATKRRLAGARNTDQADGAPSEETSSVTSTRVSSRVSYAGTPSAPVDSIAESAAQQRVSHPPAGPVSTPISVQATADGQPAAVHVPSAVPSTASVGILGRILSAFDLGGLAGGHPTTPAESPLAWALVAWTRHRSGQSTPDPAPPTQATVAPLVAAVATPAPPALVQVRTATPQTRQLSVPVKFTTAQTAGDTNIVAIGWNDATSTIKSVTDSAGNTYQLAVPIARGNGVSQAIYVAPAIKASAAGANTVTVTFNALTPYVDVRAIEYSGLAPTNTFDVGTSSSGIGATAGSGTVTTTAANELVFSAGTTTGAFTAPGSGFTSRVITTPDADIAQDKLAGTVGAYSATASLARSASWVMQVATFRTVAATGADTTPPTVTVTTPAGTVSGTVTLTANASDDVAVAGVQFLVDNAAIGGQDTTSPYSTSWDTRAVANGTHTITARATDTSGNATLSTPVSVTVNNTTVVAPPALVQVNSATPQTNQSAVTLGYTGAQTAGNTNILAIGWNNTTSTITSVVDTAGNIYQVAVPTATGGGLSQAIYYAGNIKAAAAGTNTVTVTFSSATPYVDVRATEYSGLAPSATFDVGASASGAGTTATTPSVNTTAAGDLLFGAGMTTGAFADAGAAFISRIITTPDADIVEDATAGSAGAYSATAPLAGSANWVMQVAAFRSVQQQQPPFTSTTLVSGLTQPTDFRFLPDGRMVIAQKGGTVVVANGSGQLQSTPLITLATDSSGTRGLLGIAVDPNFASNGYVYVTYTQADDAAGNTYERLSRITVTDPTAAVLTANPASETVLIQGNQPGTKDHFGGGLAFGPDGKLYWAVGDNSCCTVIDTTNSQSLSNIYGKVLRLNPDGTVPSDNPFVTTAGANPYIYAYGFRNPFRLTFTPTGQLLVGDVGEGAWEELDRVTAGRNYGWSLAEGPCNGIGVTNCSTPSSYTNPAFAYPHNGVTSSITGVTVYSGPGTSSSQPTVLIADQARQVVYLVTCTADYSSCGNPSGPPTWQWTSTSFPYAATGRTVDLTTGPDGALYQVTLDTGKITRIAPTTTPV